MTTTSDIPPAGPAGDSPPRQRRIERTRDDRLVAGVCGGLGRYFDVDPVIFRVLLGVSALFGPGLLLYAAAWVLLPEEGADRSIAQGFGRFGHADRETLAIVVLTVAGLVLLNGIFGRSEDLGWLVPVLAVGAFLWWHHKRRLPAPPMPPGGPWTGPVPPAPPGWSQATATDAPGATTPPVPPAPSTWWSGSASTAPMPPAPGSTWVGGPPQPPTPPDRPRLATLTLSLLLLVAGVVAMLDASEAIDVSAQGWLAGILIVIGSGLVVGAWFGRARGLIPLGLVVAAALMATSTVDVPYRGGFGERTWRPTAVGELTAYRLFGGEATLDLTELPVGEVTQNVEASVGMGQLTVIVPDDVTVEVDGHVGMGQLTVFDESQDGISVDEAVTDTPSVRGETARRLHLVVHVGMGEAVVRRAQA